MAPLDAGGIYGACFSDTFPLYQCGRGRCDRVAVRLGCEDADESSGKWEVFGGPTGPFRMDSRVCKAAFIAGIIDGDGGKVSPG